MTMKTEKLDRVVIYVADIEKSKALYSDLLGIEFDEIPFPDVDPVRMVPGDGDGQPPVEGADAGPPGNWRVAISRAGLELIEGALEPGAKSHVACYHFKVKDYDDAKAEMAAKGIPLSSDITLGKLREAIYHPQGDDGPMMGLVSYPDEYVMDSIRSKG
jgi:catechol 2,3-dioxygenase-like lactoylglutathione lyase family enzyme